jgi:hypothetical protein
MLADIRAVTEVVHSSRLYWTWSSALDLLQKEVHPSWGDPMFGAPLLHPGGDGEFVRWLDDMEWGQDNWINFN